MTLMNKLFSVLCVLALMFTNFTFAQYGGSSRSGGSSSALVKDTCVDGDTSGSYFDWLCGDEVEVDDDMDDEGTTATEIDSSDDDMEDEMMEDEMMEDEMMDDDMEEEGTSLFDLLKNRDSGSSSLSSSTSGDGSNGFVLPGVLAATGAEL